MKNLCGQISRSHWKSLQSSASRRVRLCLAEKGLKYESRIIDLAKGEHHSPEYLARNPNGVIPLLILPDGRSLYESSTINEYLDETYPEPPLRPADPYQRAEMRNWVRHVDERIGNLIVFNWKHGIAQVAAKLSDAELAERIRKIPSKERQEAWMRAARKPYTPAEEDEARRKLVWEIDKKLQEDAARPGVYQSQGATCWWPHVKGLKLAVNSIYNHWRFDDVWLER